MYAALCQYPFVELKKFRFFSSVQSHACIDMFAGVVWRCMRRWTTPGWLETTITPNIASHPPDTTRSGRISNRDMWVLVSSTNLLNSRSGRISSIDMWVLVFSTNLLLSSSQRSASKGYATLQRSTQRYRRRCNIDDGIQRLWRYRPSSTC